MKYKLHAKITFTIDENHPDIKHVDNWTPDKTFNFDDVYTFDADYEPEQAREYIKHDMLLVAGGGYSTEHVHNVNFFIH